MFTAVIIEEVWKCPLNPTGSVGICEQFNLFFVCWRGVHIENLSFQIHDAKIIG